MADAVHNWCLFIVVVVVFARLFAPLHFGSAWVSPDEHALALKLQNSRDASRGFVRQRRAAPRGVVLLNHANKNGLRWGDYVAQEVVRSATSLYLDDGIWIDTGDHDPWLGRDQMLHQALLDRAIAHDWNVLPHSHEGPYWQGGFVGTSIRAR